MVNLDGDASPAEIVVSHVPPEHGPLTKLFSQPEHGPRDRTMIGVLLVTITISTISTCDSGLAVVCKRFSLDAKFTCPNVDGTVAKGGCTFCDNRSFIPSRRQPRLSVADQLQEGIKRLKYRYDVDQFLSYFNRRRILMHRSNDFARCI